MKPLLIVLKVREIPQCLASYDDALDIIDQVWLCGFKEIELESLLVFDGIVEEAKEKGYTHIMIISDDATITNAVILEVLRLTDQYGIATGFCRLDYTSKFVNLSYDQLLDRRPRGLADYHFLKYDKLPDGDFQTTFTGFALTCMPVEMWQKYPFKCVYDGGPHNGSCSDWMLSKRMGSDGLKLWTNKTTEVIHEKQQASTIIGQTLFIGPQYREIIWKKKR